MCTYCNNNITSCNNTDFNTSIQYYYITEMKIFSKFINAKSALHFRRCLHLSAMDKGYEGHGKTTVTLLSREEESGIMITGYNPNGFSLNTKMRVLGPMVIFPKTVLCWNITSSQEINEDSLKLFSILEPKLEMLVIGLDDNYPPQSPVIQTIRSVMKKIKIRNEILPVDKACAVFNYLNSEGRYVVGALLPPRKKEIRAVTIPQ